MRGSLGPGAWSLGPGAWGLEQHSGRLANKCNTAATAAGSRRSFMTRTLNTLAIRSSISSVKEGDTLNCSAGGRPGRVSVGRSGAVLAGS